jgi:hypothetical protein
MLYRSSMPILRLASDSGVRVNDFRDPTEVATAFLEKYWNGSVPVRLDQIAASAGVMLIARRVEHGAWAWCSIFRTGRGSDAGPVIEFNTAETVVRQRFAVAHALGHFALGHQAPPQDYRDSFGSGTSSPMEREANVFAMALLIPTASLVSAIERRQASSIEELSDMFAVSPLSIAFRLKAIPDAVASKLSDGVGASRGGLLGIAPRWRMRVFALAAAVREKLFGHARGAGRQVSMSTSCRKPARLPR